MAKISQPIQHHKVPSAEPNPTGSCAAFGQSKSSRKYAVLSLVARRKTTAPCPMTSRLVVQNRDSSRTGHRVIMKIKRRGNHHDPGHIARRPVSSQNSWGKRLSDHSTRCRVSRGCLFLAGRAFIPNKTSDSRGSLRKVMHKASFDILPRRKEVTFPSRPVTEPTNPSPSSI